MSMTPADLLMAELNHSRHRILQLESDGQELQVQNLSLTKERGVL
jgi:hypothetical protein